MSAAYGATFIVGAVGYFIFRFLRIPNPALLGSMAATGILSATGLYPSFDTRPVSFAVDPLTASVFHTARIVGIVSFYPWIVLPLTS